MICTDKDGNTYRELAYLVRINKIESIPGADNTELAIVEGWKVLVRKNQFKVDDIAVYFEIDSKVPEVEPFMFLASKKFRVKTQRYFKGTVYSQGLLMALEDFMINGNVPLWLLSVQERIKNGENVEHTFLTKKLGITHVDEQEEKIEKKPKAGKARSSQTNLLFRIFHLNRKKERKDKFPKKFPYIKRSDEERCENLPWIIHDKEPWIKTLKIDGTSTTYILERKRFRKNEFYVCSRNVRLLNKDQACFHDKNVYWINAEKYKIREFLEKQLENHPKWKYVALQGESCGEGVQGNPHKLDGLYFYAFNFIDSEKGRWNSIEAKVLCEPYGINWVPILSTNYILPNTMEELKLSADGACDLPNSKGLREGFVYRSYDGKKSFKNVSREYLTKK